MEKLAFRIEIDKDTIKNPKKAPGFEVKAVNAIVRIFNEILRVSGKLQRRDY